MARYRGQTLVAGRQDVDTILDANSNHAIANSAVTTAVNELTQNVNSLTGYKSISSWDDVVTKAKNHVLFIGKGTVNNIKVALTIIVPIVAIRNNEVVNWQVSDAYNNTTSIHMQIRMTNGYYSPSQSGLFYGASKVSDSIIEIYYI